MVRSRPADQGEAESPFHLASTDKVEDLGHHGWSPIRVRTYGWFYFTYYKWRTLAINGGHAARPAGRGLLSPVARPENTLSRTGQR